jgi:hypothetical protein
MKGLRIIVPILLTFTILLVSLCYGDEWDKTFGGSGIDSGYSVQQTPDGGYIIAGTTTSFGAGESDIYLVKTNTNGDLVWDKTFGGSGRDEAHSLRQTVEEEYIIVAFTGSFGSGRENVYLIKTDVDGRELWGRTFEPGNFGDYLESAVGNEACQTADGGFVIIGWAESVSSWVLLIKTDADGNALWSKTFDRDERDSGFSVQETTDGGYIIAGETGHYDYSRDSYQSDIALIYYKPEPEPESPAVPPPGTDSDGGGGGACFIATTVPGTHTAD